MKGLRREAASINPRLSSRVHPQVCGSWPSRLLCSASALAALALAATLPLTAQQNPPQPAPAPSPTQSAPAAPQQPPGQGAQLHTGTSSGLSTDQRLQDLLADHQYFLVQAELSQLPPEQAQFYRGILANRNNDLKTSIELLAPLLDRVTASGDTADEKLLREALAEDYLREGDWAQAAQAYQALESRLHAALTPDEQNEIEMPLKMLPLAAGNPPTTVDPCAPFEIQASEDPLGLIDIPVFVDDRPHSWMLDPTLPFNLIDSSTAKEVGLRVSDRFVTIRTLTGRPIQVRVAVIPRFTIGGQLTLRNMTVFVYNDADYYFPQSGYQVEGVLGYPALSALGAITITDEDMVEVRPTKEIDPSGKENRLTTGARFFLDGGQIIVALTRTSSGGASAGNEFGPGNYSMYAIDAGGQQTYLTSRYFDEHSAAFAHQITTLFALPGLESSPPQPSFVAETVPLTVGKTAVKLHYIRVFTQPLGSAALDDVYGVLGVNALGQLGSYTFDYRTMRFSVQPE